MEIIRDMRGGSSSDQGWQADETGTNGPEGEGNHGWGRQLEAVPLTMTFPAVAVTLAKGIAEGTGVCYICTS